MDTRLLTACPQLTIRTLRRGGYFDGALRTWQSSTGSKLKIKVSQEALEIRSTPLKMHSRIPLAYTKQRLGGERCWLTCPECHRRTGGLFLVEEEHQGSLSCRVCLGVRYASQTPKPKQPLPAGLTPSILAQLDQLLSVMSSDELSAALEQIGEKEVPPTPIPINKPPTPKLRSASEHTQKAPQQIQPKSYSARVAPQKNQEVRRSDPSLHRELPTQNWSTEEAILYADMLSASHQPATKMKGASRAKAMADPPNDLDTIRLRIGEMPTVVIGPSDGSKSVVYVSRVRKVYRSGWRAPRGGEPSEAEVLADFGSKSKGWTEVTPERPKAFIRRAPELNMYVGLVVVGGITYAAFYPCTEAPPSIQQILRDFKANQFDRYNPSLDILLPWRSGHGSV